MSSIEHIDPWLHCKEVVERILLEAIKLDQGESGEDAVGRDAWARRIVGDVHPTLSPVTKERIRELTLLAIVEEVMEEILIDSADILRSEFCEFAEGIAEEIVDDLTTFNIESPPDEDDVREAACDLLKTHGIEFRLDRDAPAVIRHGEIQPLCLDGAVNEEDHEGLFVALAAARKRWGLSFEMGCHEIWINTEWETIEGREVDRAISGHQFAYEDGFADVVHWKLMTEQFKLINAPDAVMATVHARIADALTVIAIRESCALAKATAQPEAVIGAS